MSQLSVNRNFNQAFPGMKGDIREDTVESFLAEGAIRFGIGVVKATDPARQVKEAALSTDTFAGIALHQHVEQTLTTGIATYLDEEAVSVLRKGVVWMPIETSNVGTIAVDDSASINVAIGGSELGTVTSVSAANIADVGTVRIVDVALAIALIEIDL